MKRNAITGSLLLVAGIGIGVGISHFPVASAAPRPSPAPLSLQKFLVSLDEVNQNFVCGHEFSGQYGTTVTLSDGSRRHIQLTPMMHNGMQVVELRDNDGHTYIELNGTTTSGKLMVQVRDLATMKKQLTAEGWPATASGATR